MHTFLPSGLRPRLVLLVSLGLLPGLALVLAPVAGALTGTGSSQAIGSVTLTLLGCGTILLVTAIVTWFTCRSLVLRPLDTLAAATNRLHLGDASARAESPLGTSEFRELASAFNAMAVSLHRQTESRTREELDKQRLLKSLGERVKELTALYGTSHLLLQETQAEDALRSIVSLLPAAWQYPELAVARIRYGEAEYVTERFVSTPWCQSTCFTTKGGRNGSMEVCYLAERPPEDEGPFLAEERELLDSLTRIVVAFLQRKEAEANLRESEGRFRSAFENAPIGMALVAPDGRWIRANGSLSSILGYTEEELSGTTVLDLTHSEDVEESLRRQQRLVAGEVDAYQMEKRYRHKEGHYVWVMMTASLVRRPDDQPLYVIAQIENITHRKLSDERLHQTLGRLNTLVDISRTIRSTLDATSLLDGLLERLIENIQTADIGVVFLLDSETKTLIPAAASGYDRDALSQIRLKPGEGISGRAFRRAVPLISRNPEEALTSVDSLSPENKVLFSRARHGLEVQSNLSVPLRTPDQDVIGTITLATTHGAFTDDDLMLLEGVAGQAAVAIQNSRLFDETLAGRERLRALSHRLVEAQESERRSIAHELHDEIGQTLTLAKLNIQTLERLPEAEPVREGLRQCASNVEDSLQRVRDISVNLRPSTLDDLGLVAAIRWMVYRSAKQAGLTAHVDDRLQGKEIPAAVETTCFRVAQEAVTNTIRHARAQQIRVQIALQEASIQLTVEDDGEGFEVDEMFSRASGGHSLGLLGMQERVALLEGDLHISSKPGAGTEVRVRLPLQGAAGRPDHNEPEASL